MKCFIKTSIYIFLSCCVASTLSDKQFNFNIICYFSLLFFASYETIKSMDKEVKV